MDTLSDPEDVLPAPGRGGAVRPNAGGGEATHPRADHPAVIVVTVVRSGGITGLVREWSAEPPPEQAPRWVALVDACPWDAEEADPAGADRFVWRLHARCDDDDLEATLADRQVEGPWRTLVDEVRSFGRSSG
ncbi:protealysin inhibitor emfourin [Microbacterium hominis]|uniref:Uncharacterized protein n=1 Tax=Microbacterium hominis TaxID=162426 RepID=A0A7D4PN23_9MICO|nr:protealysin inhibitor emfourin [Microbacterium hominis]QKJ19950.1 hypothetical protein HQM25_11690 [Microbacterium hominis]